MPGDTRLAGAALLLAGLLVVANGGLVAARGGYASASFWQSTLDEKLDHIAEHEKEWLWLHAGWIAVLGALVGGMTALSLLLVQAGEVALGGLGLGLFLAATLPWCLAVCLQGAPAAMAARTRRAEGATPPWLAPLFAAIGWIEVAYIAATAVAYVLLGAAVVDSGLPTTWAGWTSAAIGALTVAGLVVARSSLTFPELPLVAPVVLGAALLLG